MNEISTDKQSQDYIEGTTFDKADGVNLMMIAIVIFLVIHVSIIGAVAYAIWSLV